jgi:hypothetical protein
MTIPSRDGDLTLGEENAHFAEVLKVTDRGIHDGFNIGPDMVQECSLTCRMLAQAITHATLARVRDFVKRTGAFGSAFTTSLDTTVWAWRVIVTFADGAVTTTKTLPLCEGGLAISEGYPSNTFAITFRNHTQPTVT